MEPEDLARLYRRQGEWFAGERSALLRKARIAAKRSVLDLGAGTGETVPELERRSAGIVVACDRDPGALAAAPGRRIAAEACRLPFCDGVFDLVFTQMFFLWASPVRAVIEEIRRVLAPGGHLVAAAEPDYGGAIEYPEPRRGLSALAEDLATAGADVTVGRRLGGLLQRRGFEVVCGVHPSRPLEAACPDSIFAAPELHSPDAGLEFLYLPYFTFLALRS